MMANPRALTRTSSGKLRSEPPIALLPQHSLANLGVPARSRSRETLEMGAGKSSVPRTFDTDSHRGEFIACSRSSVRIARGVLGCDRNARSYAINARRDCIDFDCRYG